MQGCMCSEGMGGVDGCMLCSRGEVARCKGVCAVGVWGVWNGVCCAVGERWRGARMYMQWGYGGCGMVYAVLWERRLLSPAQLY